jgi:hypothetical protein
MDTTATQQKRMVKGVLGSFVRGVFVPAFVRVDVVGNYRPVVSVQGTHRPTVTVVGTYRPIVTVVGNWSDA